MSHGMRVLVLALGVGCARAWLPQATRAVRARRPTRSCVTCSASASGDEGTGGVSASGVEGTGGVCSRRQLTGVAAAATAASVLKPDAAVAAESSPFAAIDNYLVAKRRDYIVKSRPEPVLAPRARMEQEFAVLCMRTSYSSVDELDFVAMDEFQKDFYLYRQSEYENYLQSLQGRPIMQGDLTDPVYFDFISYAQYATIWNDMNKGLFTFTEAGGVNAEGETVPDRIVRRDIEITNAMLPELHAKMVGDQILQNLMKRYNKSPDDPSCCVLRVAKKPTLEFLTSNIKQLLTLFQVNNFMSGFELTTGTGVAVGGREAVSVGSEVEILMSSPANRWSQEMLTRRPQALINNFEVKAIQAYLRACGCSGELARPTRFKGNDVFHSIRIIT